MHCGKKGKNHACWMFLKGYIDSDCGSWNSQCSKHQPATPPPALFARAASLHGNRSVQLCSRVLHIYCMHMHLSVICIQHLVINRCDLTSTLWSSSTNRPPQVHVGTSSEVNQTLLSSARVWLYVRPLSNSVREECCCKQRFVKSSYGFAHGPSQRRRWRLNSQE